MNKANRTLAILLSLLTALPLVACGEEKVPSDGIDVSSDTTVANESGYNYPDVDYGGYEFRVLNFDEYCNTNLRVDVEEQTGEKLDDAIYLRNRKVEDKLGFKMKEIQYPGNEGWSTSQKNLINLVTTSVMAGDDEYDAAYLNLYFNTGVITDGCLVALTTIDTLDLKADWWDHTINDSITINGKLFGASSPMMLETFDFAWCLFFNESLMTDFKMDYPYQLVRDGKWTIDKLYEYVSAGATLNGDSDFKNWKDDGNSIYGIAGHLSAADYTFLHSAGCDYISNVDGEYKLVVESDRLYTAFDRLKTLLSLDSGYVRFDNSNREFKNGYLSMFANDRALFMTGELKSAMEERDMVSDFGILPFPKLEESDNYRTLVNGCATALLCVPVTNKDLDRTGVILDALSYESNESVLPVYYDVTVSQKGLRNDDSIEMLEIIKETRSCELADFFGLAGDMVKSFQKILASGGTEAPASVIASNKEKIANNIATLIENIEKLG